MAPTAFDDPECHLLTPVGTDKEAAGFRWAMRRASEFAQLRSTLGEHGLDFAGVRDRLTGRDTSVPFEERGRWRALAPRPDV